MTSWQDQQPQSRRALRESERAHSQGTASDTVEDQPTESDFDRNGWEEQSSASSPKDSVLEHSEPPHSEPPHLEQPLRRSRRSGTTRPEADPSSADSAAYRLRDFSPETRGATFSSTQTPPWTPPAPGSEDLNYKTSVEATKSATNEPSAPAVTPPVVATQAETPTEAVVPEPDFADGPMEHTLTRREIRELRNAAAHESLSETSAEEAAPDAPSLELSVPEVRAPEMVEPHDVEAHEVEPHDLDPQNVVTPELDSAEFVASPVPLVTPPVELVTPPVEKTTGAAAEGELAAAMAEFDKLFHTDPSVPQLVEPTVEKTDAAAPAVAEASMPAQTLMPTTSPEPAVPTGFDWSVPGPELVNPLQEQSTPSVPLVETPPEPHGEPVLQGESEVSPEPWTAPEVPAPRDSALTPEAPRKSRRASSASVDEPVTAVEVEPVATVIVEPVAESVNDTVVEILEPAREVVTAPEVNTAPPGHWSSQVATDEGPETVARPHQRDIASSDAITTSALILPTFPVSMPTTGPVSGTGEILMTGSITLPRSLGVNGLHPSRYDRPDIDDIIDAADRHDVLPDAAPVRAVRAVSTYTSPQGLINAKRPKGNNLLTILAITAGVMMVGVVVLMVVGMIFKIF